MGSSSASILLRFGHSRAPILLLGCDACGSSAPVLLRCTILLLGGNVGRSGAPVLLLGRNVGGSGTTILVLASDIGGSGAPILLLVRHIGRSGTPVLLRRSSAILLLSSNVGGSGSTAILLLLRCSITLLLSLHDRNRWCTVLLLHGGLLRLRLYGCSLAIGCLAIASTYASASMRLRLRCCSLPISPALRISYPSCLLLLLLILLLATYHLDQLGELVGRQAL